MKLTLASLSLHTNSLVHLARPVVGYRDEEVASVNVSFGCCHTYMELAGKTTTTSVAPSTITAR